MLIMLTVKVKKNPILFLNYLCVTSNPGNPRVVLFPKIFKLIRFMHFLPWPGKDPDKK